MSALTDPKGFKLSTWVEAQRGMSIAEIFRFLETGVEPDLSQPPFTPESGESLSPDTEIFPPSIVEDWLAGKFPDAVVASALAFRFNPHQPRDSEGKWTDGAPEVSAPNFKIPGGTSNAPTPASPAGKKITPAVIYKKHADGAVVAESGNRRMRWDAEAKKFVVEERQSDTWQETARLTKSAAYEDAKAPGRWLQPGTMKVAALQKVQSEPVPVGTRWNVDAGLTRLGDLPDTAQFDVTQVGISDFLDNILTEEGNLLVSREEMKQVGEPEMIDLAGLTLLSHQSTASVSKIRHYLNSGLPEGDSDLPTLTVLPDGKVVVKDGNHRVIASLLAGETKVRANVHRVSSSEPETKPTVSEPSAETGDSALFSSKYQVEEWVTAQNLPKPSEHAESALKFYGEKGYQHINSWLRQGTSKSLGAQDAFDIRKHMKNSRTKTPITVSRMTEPSAFPAPLDQLVGQTITDKGFVSTTALPSADHFKNNQWWDSKDVKMIIDVPVGARVVHMDPYATVKGQHEILLDAETKMEILGVHKEVNGKWTVTAKVLL